MKKYYMSVTVVMLVLVAVQSVSYDEYEKVEAVGRVMGGGYPDGRILSEAYRDFMSTDPCLNSELPTTGEPADHEERITKVFREILEEYAIRPVGYGEGINGGFTQYVLVHGRRANFTLGLEVVQDSDGTYRLNGINGLCDLLRDVNGFKAYAEDKECTLERPVRQTLPCRGQPFDHNPFSFESHGRLSHHREDVQRFSTATASPTGG